MILLEKLLHILPLLSNEEIPLLSILALANFALCSVLLLSFINILLFNVRFYIYLS